MREEKPGGLEDRRTSTWNIGLVFVALILLTVSYFSGRVGNLDAFDRPPVSPEGIIPIIWDEPLTLPTQVCYGSSTRNCQRSSPVLEDINEDGYLDIIVATNSGHVLVVERDGNILWDRDISPYFGMGANKQNINSTPAVADIDNDGNMEVVVGAGTINPEVCTQGGVIVLNHLGDKEPGWPQLAEDWAIAPSGCRDTVYSSPAVGDMDNDGDLEVVVGGFDTTIRAWHHDGTLLPGYPPDSYLYEQLGWGILEGHLADTVWSSPALVDLDQDGYLDLVLGTDEGNQGNGWVCPYQPPPDWRAGYCGGSVYVLDRNGDFLPGWPRHFLEAIQSTIAVADLNLDGSPDLVIGKGTFYRNKSPDRPTYAFVLHVKDSEGNDLPGWQGGKMTGGPIASPPTLGDIAGDEQPEVIVLNSEESKLYAWHANGQPVAGFPMTPVDLFGDPSLGFNFGQSPLLVDVDGDGKMEIMLNQDWVVTIVDGTGAQLTASFYPGSQKPSYYAEGSLLNSPAAGDIDNDGKLELIAFNSRLYVWELENSSEAADWPMFKRTASGNPAAPIGPHLMITAEQLLIFKDMREPGPAYTTFELRNSGDMAMEWLAVTPPGVTLSPGSGVLDGHDERDLEVTVDRSALAQGMNYFGNITIIASADGGAPVPGSPSYIDLSVYFGIAREMFLPVIDR